MIKCLHLTFTEVPCEDHWAKQAAFGQIVTEDKRIVNSRTEFNMKLNPEYVYQMSLDQSTSNTGIFVKNIQNTEAFLIEVAKVRGQSPSDYIFDLEMFLRDLAEGITFSHVIYEKPIKSESYQSSRVLFQLEGMLLMLDKRYKSYHAAKFDNIVNSSWRSVVILPQYADYSRKEASRLSINAIFPWTKLYGSSLGSDEDVFEAVGIMMGWFATSFDAFGRPYVRGDASRRQVGGFVFPGVHGNEMQAMLKQEDIESEYCIANPRYSICQNLTAGVAEGTVRCVEISDPYTMLSLCVECNIRWADYDIMTVIICDTTTVPARLRTLSGGEFHFVI